MYDYMKALQKRFDRQEHSKLDAQIERAHEELRRDMDAVGRKKLLRLLDAQNTLLVESKLMSFTAGFKLAWGMAKELEADRNTANWTPRSKVPMRNCGGTWMPWGAENCCGCWTHRTHCWLNQS